MYDEYIAQLRKLIRDPDCNLCRERYEAALQGWIDLGAKFEAQLNRKQEASSEGTAEAAYA